MKKRELEDWEMAECVALKKAIDAFNAGKPRGARVSQGQLADALGINQGSVSAYLNGVNALNAKVAGIVAAKIGVPVESFSPRLAKEIGLMAKGVSGQAPANSVIESQGSYRPQPDADLKRDQTDAAALLEGVAALHVIQAALLTGAVSKEQLKRLMSIRHEIVHQQPARGDQGQRLQGLIEAAFTAEGNGGSPDDLLKMYQRGMEKQFAREGAKTNEPGKKPARRS